ncbi:hypothetical protein LJ737_25345 [Hymenobacter sp. 15J16-1T3B]|uniref:hypothetical protein n=1 Tax=Hymenobacter sp. 15J16-1T3B TaxID=2886941 RepID=UPI001D10F793|nr:hypothetical protein [Hymenobacter sp. 15J16-1T3B]MCC3160588.1 hypothetical protein [Hymenobacter sp. 15J16-1T3B]
MLFCTACGRQVMPAAKTQSELGRTEFVKSCIGNWRYFQLDHAVELRVIHFSGGGLSHTGWGANPAMLLGVTAAGDSIRVLSRATATLKRRGKNGFREVYDKRIRVGVTLLVQPDSTIRPNDDSAYPWFPRVTVNSEAAINQLNCSVTQTCFGKIQFLTANN